MPYRCLVFDFDGTIADTLDETRAVLNELAEEYNFRRMEPHHLSDAKKMTLGQFVHFLGVPSWRVPILLTKGKRLLTERLPTIRPFPEMAGVLQVLKPEIEQLGILTSNSVGNVQSFLDTHDFVPFDFIQSAKRLLGKARYLKSIAKKYNIPPGEILYVGDEIRDIEAAQEAHMPVVAVTWGFNAPAALEEAAPDHLISHPRELVKIVTG